MKTIKNLKAEEIHKSILQLAIQGKLVKQDPNDEPASELVKRIYAEKQRLIKEGKIKKDKNESFIFKGDDNCYYEKICDSEPVKLEDLPFDIPDSWTWIRLKDLIHIQTGASFKKEQSIQEAKSGFVRVLRGGNILPFQFLLKNDDLYIPQELVSNDILLRKNDLITPAVTSLENIGKIAVITNDLINVTAGGFVYIFRPYINDEIISNLIADYVSSSAYQSMMKDITKKSGQAFYNMNKEKLLQLYFPIAPLAEMIRIVDKVKKCEPLIDEYSLIEEKLSELENEFPDKLKKSILQYAIEGKLVKQDPNDEPASVLLERIKAEKERLIKEGKIKRDKNESYIYQADDKNYYENFLFYYHSFDIPSGWEICKLAEITEFIHRGKSPVYSSIEEIPVIAQKCNQKDGSLSLEKALFIDPASLCKYDKTKISKPNDIIVNSTGTGTVGRVNILNTSLFEKYQTIVTDSHVTTIRLIENECDPLFIYFYLKSPLIYDHAEERSEGSTNQIELYAKTIMNYCLCLPPKNEQTRISRKISRLLSHL